MLRSKLDNKGVGLIEAMIGIVIASIGLLIIVDGITNSNRNTQEISSQLQFNQVHSEILTSSGITGLNADEETMCQRVSSGALKIENLCSRADTWDFIDDTANCIELKSPNSNSIITQCPPKKYGGLGMRLARASCKVTDINPLTQSRVLELYLVGEKESKEGDKKLETVNGLSKLLQGPIPLNFRMIKDDVDSDWKFNECNGLKLGELDLDSQEKVCNILGGTFHPNEFPRCRPIRAKRIEIGDFKSSQSKATLDAQIADADLAGDFSYQMSNNPGSLAHKIYHNKNKVTGESLGPRLNIKGNMHMIDDLVGPGTDGSTDSLIAMGFNLRKEIQKDGKLRGSVGADDFNEASTPLMHNAELWLSSGYTGSGATKRDGWEKIWFGQNRSLLGRDAKWTLGTPHLLGGTSGGSTGYFEPHRGSFEINQAPLVTGCNNENLDSGECAKNPGMQWGGYKSKFIIEGTPRIYDSNGKEDITYGNRNEKPTYGFGDLLYSGNVRAFSPYINIIGYQPPSAAVNGAAQQNLYLNRGHVTMGVGLGAERDQSDRSKAEVKDQYISRVWIAAQGAPGTINASGIIDFLSPENASLGSNYYPSSNLDFADGGSLSMENGRHHFTSFPGNNIINYPSSTIPQNGGYSFGLYFGHKANNHYGVAGNKWCNRFPLNCAENPKQLISPKLIVNNGPEERDRFLMHFGGIHSIRASGLGNGTPASNRISGYSGAKRLGENEGLVSMGIGITKDTNPASVEDRVATVYLAPDSPSGGEGDISSIMFAKRATGAASGDAYKSNTVSWKNVRWDIAVLGGSGHPHEGMFMVRKWDGLDENNSGDKGIKAAGNSYTAGGGRGVILKIDPKTNTTHFNGPVEIHNTQGGTGGGIIAAPAAPVKIMGDLQVDGKFELKMSDGSYKEIKIGAPAPGDEPVRAIASDARLKSEIQTYKDPLDTILRLRGVNFSWKQDNELGIDAGPDVGVIAQEVEAVIPQLVETGKDGFKRVRYHSFLGIVIEALKELVAKVESLFDRTEILEAQVADLKAKNEALEKRLEKIEALLQSQK